MLERASSISHSVFSTPNLRSNRLCTAQPRMHCPRHHPRRLIVGLKICFRCTWISMRHAQSSASMRDFSFSSLSFIFCNCFFVILLISPVCRIYTRWHLLSMWKVVKICPLYQHPPLTVQFLIQTSADGFGLNVSVRLGESRSVMWEPGRVKIRDIDATRLPKPEQLKIPHYHPCG